MIRSLEVLRQGTTVVLVLKGVNLVFMYIHVLFGLVYLEHQEEPSEFIVPNLSWPGRGLVQAGRKFCFGSQKVCSG